ncbi:MAG: IncP-type conjugative transfer protein TrbC [Gemmatimonadetes bacterium]|nr:IncP-type conjugative transfer protein TrbC [Gemmatimonadota bacterium]
MSIARRFYAIATGTRARWFTLLSIRPRFRFAWRNRWSRAVAFALPAVLYSTTVMAASAGSNMPWNGPLTNLLNNITGPTARAVCGIGVAICGLIWMMKRHEEGAGRLGQAVVGGALVFGAQTFVSVIGFAGALV